MSGAAPTREVAYRVFADEFADATYQYAESNEDRAPQYLVTPTGARINRLFVAGVLTETEEVSDGVLRARIVDPTGAFVLYAGQYQPDALAFFERADPPMFVALTGKARTFKPDGSDRVLTSLRPERVSEVDSETRDSWVVQTALHTLERTGVLGMALEADERGEDLRSMLAAAGVESGLAAGIPHAIREYEPTTGYLATIQEMALDAVRVVAGETDEVTEVSMAPDEGGTGDVKTGFTDVTLEGTGAETASPEPETEEVTEEPGPAEPAVIEPEAEQASESDESEPEPTAPDAESSEELVTEDSTETGEERPGAETAPSETEAEPTEPEEVPDEPEAEEGDELYELSEEERAEVEENFDVGFESGAEIGGPEETADIEPDAEIPDESETVADETDTETAETTAEEAGETEAEAAEETEAGEEEPSETTDAEPDEFTEGELQNLVVDTLQELGDGAGVPRSTLIETLQERHGLDEADIEEAIQAALLGGRCFESGAEDLKPI